DFELGEARAHVARAWRVDAERLDDLDPALAIQLGQDRTNCTAIRLAVDLLLEAARACSERDTAANEDRRGQRAVTRTTTLLPLRLLGRAVDLRTRLLRLGAGATRIAVRNHDLMHEVLAELGTEYRLGDGHRLARANDADFHRVSP